MVHRSLVDFFNSIGQQPTHALQHNRRDAYLIEPRLGKL
jgi:hypothetical protein